MNWQCSEGNSRAFAMSGAGRSGSLKLLGQLIGCEGPRKAAIARVFSYICLIKAAGSDGRRNTIWYKSVFQGGVYEGGETIWAFGGAEE